MKFLSNWKNDVILCLLLFVVAFSLLFILKPSQEGECVAVYVENNEVARYSLAVDGEYEITSGEHYLVLKIQDGCAFVCETNCPDHTCEKSGTIQKAGESLICLPAKIVIKVLGESEVDAYA